MKYSKNRSMLPCFVVLAVIWFIFCWPWFVDGNIIPFDAKNHFYAMVRFAATSYHNDENAAWSPFHYGGFPMLADPQSTLLTPTLWPAIIFSKTPSLHFVDALQLLHLLITGIAVFAFGKGRSWHSSAALIAAVTAMLGGALTIRLEHVLMTVSFMWFTVALWRLDVLIRSGGWSNSLAFGLSLGLMLLDRDHVAYLGAWFLLLHWLGHVAITLHENKLPVAVLPIARKQLPVAFGGLIGMMMALIPILLLLQLADNSSRPGFDFETASWQSLHPAALATFVLPELFGSLKQTGDYWGPAGYRWGGENLKMHRGMLHFYLGALPVVLILWLGILKRQIIAPGIRGFAICSLIFLFYSLGRYTPFFQIIHELIPGVGLFRRPADGLFMFGIAISLLSGALLNRALQTSLPKTNFSAGTIAAITLSLSLYSMIAMSIKHGHANYLFSNLLFFLLIAVIIMGLITISIRFPSVRDYTLAGLVFLVSYDLILHTSGTTANARPPDYYETQNNPKKDPVFGRLIELLETKDPNGVPWRVETLGFGPAVQNIGQAAGFHNLLGYNPIRLYTFDKHLAPDMQNNASNKRRFGDVMTGYNTEITNLLGLKYIVTSSPITDIDPNIPENRFRLIETIKTKGRTARIYENEEAESRVSVITKSGSTLENAAVINHYKNTEISISVTSPEAGRLILYDFDYPGWTVSVNNIEMPLIRDTGLFRSVLIPNGKSEVVFKFDLLSRANLKTILSQFFKEVL